MKKIILTCAIFLFLLAGQSVFAHQPRLIYLQTGDVQVNDPELSQAFYDELKGEPKDYFIDSDKNFLLYANILVPLEANREGRYTFNIYSEKDDLIFSSDISSVAWTQIYEPFGRDYYLKGPEFEQQMPAGKYKIQVSSPPDKSDNQGKYVLAVGKTESFDIKALLNVYWQLPALKMQFFKTDILQFFLTPFGIGAVAVLGGLLLFLAIIYYIIGAIRQIIKHRMAKTLLLTSSGMPEMKDEIIKLLQKPAYDVTVAFISTAAKPQENIDYLKKDWDIMREMGFNLEEVDMEGKTYAQVLKSLELRDIIFVEGGNTFYLLKAMRACKFEKIMRRLLKQGKVYVGVSAGSIVAGKTIKTAEWFGDENKVNLKNLKGLNLVPFDVFVHYQPEHAQIIKKKLPFKWQRKKLKIITDQQAILVQGKEVALIGDGEAVVI